MIPILVKYLYREYNPTTPNHPRHKLKTTHQLTIINNLAHP